MPVCASEPPLRALAASDCGGAEHAAACWLTQPPARPQADPASDAPVPSRAVGRRVLLELRGVTKHFALRSRRLGRQKLRAVDGVDLTVDEGETLGLVGESGSGKSTLARLIVRLHRPTAGEIIFQGQPIGSADRRTLRPLRRDIQMVFQNPYASLNQRMRIGAAIAEPILVHRLASTRSEAMERATDLLRRVGLGREALERYPHEFSGGQRQRIGIARALAVGPKLIVADEPVSSLDVTSPSCGKSPTASRSSISARSLRSQQPARCSNGRCIPTHARSLPPCRSPMLRSSEAGRNRRCWGSSRARRLQAAASGRAARSPRRSAPNESRR
jgi:ABC-type dipeptide/oligopeptide/nickel transport system ATPase subunit